ncbi:MAG: UPF0179 family protein [Candidatus Bathyarchaeia archaeon]|nr:UPF0179 family protein [Candidatus Bathyarchaeota archaeon]
MSKTEKRERIIITLLGVGQAKVGESFIHKGSGSKCNECKYFNICVKNLESGRVYRVISLRDKILKCEMYDIEMRVVEVVESEVLAAIDPKQAIKNVILTFHPQKCDEHGCENAALCSPEHLKDSDRCEVIEVYESLRCPKGLQFVKVLLKRVPPPS